MSPFIFMYVLFYYSDQNVTATISSTAAFRFKGRLHCCLLVGLLNKDMSITYIICKMHIKNTKVKHINV